ncbi:membrane protein [Thermococcus litoralis DSM 5473]|uniref:Membrane protein n=1 Tax=Thermococcus litoralis (strain ATCC 51850 / DSM 5473 / JCM 8560 / NS-C) TaxID=523849 RepID=H3ZL88_THELN|nr:hypothetical protein [Thermococcus litoralis]EHR79291.1 membrane protein [Thermococcus litoralis DSM 5473]
MIIYEPIMLAMPLAEKIKDQILQEKEIPDGESLRKILVSLGLEEVCLGRGLALFRSKYVLALLIPSAKYITVDVFSSSGDLSDALQLMMYYDKTLNAYIVDIIPANDLEFEGNIGLEPVIIDAETFELKSIPVLGYFEKENGDIFLVISEKTYDAWKESGKLEVCPVCGADGLVWQKDVAYCSSCGFGVKVVKK